MRKIRSSMLFLFLLVSVASAANKTVTVKGSGGDYTTLQGALVGEQDNLVSNQRILTIECYASAAPDTTQVNTTGLSYTVSPDYYINIYVPQSERHHGIWDESKYYVQLTNSMQFVITISIDYTRLDGLQARMVGESANYGSVYHIVTTNGGVRFSNSIARGGENNVDFVSTSGGTNYMWNVVGYENSIGDGTGNFRFFSDLGSAIFYVYNCVSIPNKPYISAFRRYSGTVYVKNSYGLSQGPQDWPPHGRSFEGIFTLTTTASNDSWSDSNVGYDNSVFTNITSGSEDYHLPLGSALIDVGTDLSATFTDDIDGQTRTAPWDIGVDEYVVAGPSGPSDNKRVILSTRDSGGWR